jgi:hypothetical protein
MQIKFKTDDSYRSETAKHPTKMTTASTTGFHVDSVDRVKAVIKKKAREFSEFMEQIRAQRLQRFDNFIELGDFKACLKAFGLSLPEAVSKIMINRHFAGDTKVHGQAEPSRRA